MTPADISSDVSRSRLRLAIAMISTVLRQCAWLTAATVGLLLPSTDGWPATLLMAGVAGWALYRLLTRSRSALAIAGDAAWTVAVGAAVPVLAAPSDFAGSTSVTQSIVTVALVTLGVQLPVRWSAVVVAAAAAAYFRGVYAVVGGDVAIRTTAAIVGSWLVAVLLRAAIEHVARTADRIRDDLLTAEISSGIAEARRRADREQLAMLHDTAAATLLLVAQTSAAPTERLAAQAARDLDVLQGRPPDSTALVDLMALLRTEATAFTDLPIDFTGLDHVWLDAELAHVICSACREALNNVDRHARAHVVTVYAGWQRLEITDDGTGFTPGPSQRHGIRESIVARMRRVGGDALIRSAPGVGTTVELRWPPERDDVVPLPADELLRSLRSWYLVAAVATGLVLLALGTWPHPLAPGLAALQIGLGVMAACCALAATSRTLRRARATVWVAAAMLVMISVGLHAGLAVWELDVYADWSLAVTGFCLLPLLFGLPAHRAVAFLVAVWTVPAVFDLVREPTAHTVAYLAVASSAFLVPQLAAGLFGASVWDAIRRAHENNAASRRLKTREAVTAALRSECSRSHADTLERLIPLLRTLADGGPVTEELRREARAECRRLRALFDQSGPEATALSQRIQALIGKAEQRGVNVTAHLDGDLPILNRDSAEDMLGHVDAALAQARSWARIILTAAQAEVDLSVVCDVRAMPGIATRPPGGRAEVVVADDTMWLTLRAG